MCSRKGSQRTSIAVAECVSANLSCARLDSWPGWIPYQQKMESPAERKVKNPFATTD